LILEIVSFELAIIDFWVSLRNLIVILNDWSSPSSSTDVVCGCELIDDNCSIWLIFVSVGIGICSEINSSVSLDLKPKDRNNDDYFICSSYSLSDSCSVNVSLGDVACSVGEFKLGDGAELVLSSSII
jgi:hypothetical protein